MKIFIDQSGKIEQTSKPTVIAYSNGKSKSIVLSAKDKRELLKIYRKAGKPNVFVLKTFATLIFLLLKKEIKLNWQIILDTEYKGYNSTIKSYLLQLFRDSKIFFPKENISFGFVGKRSKCHIIAISVLRKTLKPDLVAKFKDVLREDL